MLKSVVADMQLLGLGYVGRPGMGLFGSPPMGSYLLPIDTYGLSLTVFFELAGTKSVSARPTRIRLQIALKRYHFVEWKKWN